MYKLKYANRNIVFVGMPGAGKSTIGRKVAEKLGLNFYDLDNYIEQHEEQSIPELFLKGEENFRRAETNAVREISKVSNSVISTGGGVVKIYENIRLLKENGVIIFIDRPIDDIVNNITLHGRPLISDNKNNLYDLFEARYALYQNYSDFQVKNDCGMDCVVNKILELLVAY